MTPKGSADSSSLEQDSCISSKAHWKVRKLENPLRLKRLGNLRIRKPTSDLLSSGYLACAYLFPSSSCPGLHHTCAYPLLVIAPGTGYLRAVRPGSKSEPSARQYHLPVPAARCAVCHGCAFRRIGSWSAYVLCPGMSNYSSMWIEGAPGVHLLTSVVCLLVISACRMHRCMRVEDACGVRIQSTTGVRI